MHLQPTITHVDDRASIPLALSTLGTAKLFVDGRRSILDRRPLALLAYLLDAIPKPVTRDELADVFWPRVPMAKARHSISQVIHAIRLSEPGIRLLASKEDVLLESHIVWDVRVVEQTLRKGEIGAAAHMLNGRFLANIDVQSHRFEDWRSNIDAQLIKLITDNLPAWIEECFFRSDQRLVRSALRSIHAVLDLRLDDFDLPAGVRNLLDDAPYPENKSDTFGSGLEPAPLIGRHSQRRVLREAWQRAQGRRGSVHLVAGDTGMGKTRLCTAFLRTIPRDASTTISVRCYNNARNHGFNVLRQVLANENLSPMVHLMPDPWGSVLRPLIGDGALPESDQLEEWQSFVFEATARLLEIACQTEPLVLFIDDAQWIDPASLDCICYAARRDRDNPALLLLAARSEQNRLPENMSKLTAVAGAIRVELPHLTYEEIRQFIASRSPSASNSELTNEIFALTSGHPFLVSELVQSIEVDGSAWTKESVRTAAASSVVQQIAERLGSLSVSSRRLLSVLAILGKPYQHVTVRRIAGLSRIGFLSAFEDLLHRGLIADVEGQISCRHDLIREIAYNSLTVTQTVMLHSRVARTLETIKSPAQDVVLHYARGKCRRKVYFWALRAARSNLRTSSPDETDHFLALAARATPNANKRLALLWRRANHAHDAGRLNRAIPLYERMASIGGLSDSRLRYIEARRLDALCLVGTLTSDAINQLGLSLADATFRAATIDTHVQCLRSLVRYNFLRSNFAQATDAVTRMSAVSAKFPGTQGAARALIWKAIIKLADGNGVDANELAGMAAEEASKFDDPRLAADLLTVSIMTKAFVGELKASFLACEKGVELAEKHRFFRFRNMCLANMSAVAMDMGLEAIAERNLVDVVRAAESNEVPADIAHGYFNLAVLRFSQRRLDEVETLAKKCFELAEESGNHFIKVSSQALLGTCALERGRLHEARQRKMAIINDIQPYIGDDIVPIEHFLARMSELENKIDAGISRLESLVKKPPPFVNACCQLELRLELARLLVRKQKRHALTLVQEVKEQAAQFEARAIVEAADVFLTRHSRPQQY